MFYFVVDTGFKYQIKQPNKTVTDLAILRHISLQKYKTCFLSNIVLIGNYCMFFPCVLNITFHHFVIT